MMSQQDRVRHHVAGERPPPVALRLRFRAIADAHDVVQRAGSVMELVASAQAVGWWPDEEWKRRLPAWFVASFRTHTLEALLRDPSLWDFGSWLDAMKDPGWEWWSSDAAERHGSVRCVAHTDPFAIEPLMYLLRASGADEVHLDDDLP